MCVGDGDTNSGTDSHSTELVFRHESVEANFEDSSLPCVPVEHIYCSACILCCSEKNSTITAAAIVGTERDICSQDSARFAEEILQVLPTNSVRELKGESETI